MKPRRVVGLVCVSALFAFTLTGCSWFSWLGHSHGVDPLTREHLETIAAAGKVSKDSCASYVAHEQSKQDAKDPKFDARSLDHMKKVCDCFAKADPAVPLEMASCTTLVRTALLYEQAKSK